MLRRCAGRATAVRSLFRRALAFACSLRRFPADSAEVCRGFCP